jgi:hypothetical protein
MRCRQRARVDYVCFGQFADVFDEEGGASVAKWLL